MAYSGWEHAAVVLGGESFTALAENLQKAGLIHYARGHITILDRSGLEAATCECYRVVRDEFERLLGQGTTSLA
jgi:hypothetical protein